MDSNLSSRQNLISTYNKRPKLLQDILKIIYVDAVLYPTTYACLRLNNITYALSGIKKPLLIESSAELLNPCTGFNMTMENLRDMIYYLVKEGRFSMSDLERTDWFFANVLYEKLYDEIDKRRKQQEEDNKRQEQEMANYQQMQDYQSRMMSNINQYMPSGLN